MVDYTEKRSYKRVKVECNIHYKMLDSDFEENEVGQLENISGRGLMFIAERGVPLNSELEIRVDIDVRPAPRQLACVVCVAREDEAHGTLFG